MVSIFAGKYVHDFINEIVLCNSVQEILNKCTNPPEMGYIYERLWDIIIKFGYCDKFPKSQFIDQVGNANIASLCNLKTYGDFLKKKISSGSSGGYSDITLFDNLNNKTIFISSKYKAESQNDAVDNYGIQEINLIANHNSSSYPSYDIFLLVRNKKFVLELGKKAKTSSDAITHYFVDDHILDQKDLEHYFQHFQRDFFKFKPSTIPDFDKFFLNEKVSLVARFHQELITDETLYFALCHGYPNYRIKNFLWGCKCRSGKTYMVGILIDKFMQFYKKKNINNGKLNVLIITPVPTETMPQFTEYLFYKFREFIDFNIWEAKHLDNINSNSSISSTNNIFIFSKQFLDRHTKENTILRIKNLHLNLIFFDENHFGGATMLSKEIIDSYFVPQTIKVFLTATYKKPLDVWEIPPDGQMYWSMEDEQICKDIFKNNNNIKYLIERHQKVQDTIKKFHDMKYSTNEIFECYLSMPDMYFLTTLFDSERFDEIKANIADSKYGFSFESLFAITNKQFKYDDEVRKVLQYISGSNKEEDFKDGDRSILSRIDYLCKSKESRYPFTQIWFLPPNNIGKTSKYLQKIMAEDLKLKDYSILCINSSNNELGDVKKSIDKCIQEARDLKNNKRGVILLAGNMLSLGITIESCDVVMLLNNSLSSDKVMQQMFRCMTEGKAGDKKMGFVVDLNISRVLNTCINFSARKNNNNNVEDNIKYIVEHHLINIDVDYFENRPIDSTLLINRLLEIWKNDPINNFKTLLKNLDNDCISFDNEIQKQINSHFSTNNYKEISASVKVNTDETDERFPTGTVTSPHNSNKKIKIEPREKNISFTEDVLPYIVPLSCILTFKEYENNFIKILNFIRINPELLSIFDEMCVVWFKHDKLIDFIKNIISDYFKSSSNLHGIVIQINSSLHNLLNEKKSLLELIHNCLKVKNTEKKQYGEVFTPMKFINNDMLKKLEDHYLSHNNSNIWENMNLKFFDPAAGMGNFPIAIYYKLMTGLQHIIPDESQRQKHIVENMLYMAELNVKNCFVIKQIFNINNNYHLNLFQGDSLMLNIENEFQLNKFDVVIGNPPYNESFNDAGAGASALYHKFINYYIDKCDFLSFIIPSRWFSGGKGVDGFRKSMLSRNDIVFIQHEDDASKIFGNGVNIEGGVNYFLIDKNYNNNNNCQFNNVIIDLSKYDILVSNPSYYKIIDNIIMNHHFQSLSTIYLGRCFGLEPNEEEKEPTKLKFKSDIKNDDTNQYLKCFVSLIKQQKTSGDRFILKKDIKVDYDFFKVITAEANGSHKCFGNIFIGQKNEVHTGSYISFKVDSEFEAKSLASYMRCKLPNFLLSIRKISQHISNKTISWIPLPSLEQFESWSDDDVYDYFHLSKEDIEIVKSTYLAGYRESNNSSEKRKI